MKQVKELGELVDRLEAMYGKPKEESLHIQELGTRLTYVLIKRAKPKSGAVIELWRKTYDALPSYKHIQDHKEYAGKMADKYLECYKVVDTYLKEMKK